MGFLSNLFGAKKFHNDINNYTAAGNAAISYGTNIYNRAVSSLDSLDTDLTGRLASGLPDDVRATYRQARGAVSDETARANNSFGVNLVQRARATGGAITPQAALDAQIENNAGTENAAFNAKNAISADEAQTSLANTNKLLDSIMQVRSAKLGAGIDEQNLGANITGNSLSIEQRRRAALMQAVTSIFGSYSSSAGH